MTNPCAAPKKEIPVKWKLLAVLLVVQIPFCLLFLYTVRSARIHTNDHLASVQASAMDVYLESIQKQMEQVMEYLFVECWSSEAFRSSSSAQTAAEAFALLSTSIQEAQDVVELNSDITAVILYHRASGMVSVALSDSNENESRRQRLEQAAGKLVDSSSALNTGWEVQKISGQNCLVRICGWGESYAIVVLNLAELANNLRVDYRMVATVLFRQNGTDLTDAFWARGYDDSMKYGEREEQGYYFVRNNDHVYLVTEARLASLKLVCASDYQYSWNWLYGAAGLLVAAILGTFTLGVIYLRQVFLRPLDKLVGVMQMVCEGNTMVRAPKSGSREFDRIGEIFNEMLYKIEELKIETYESQLAIRKAEMDALRLQIRRHFFLNCLKNIYALACSGEVELIKQSVLLLSTNLRYTLAFRRDKVSLKEELERCADYMELQGIGQQYKPKLRISLCSLPEGFCIPPVSLLTMLENCCKYGTRQDCALEVLIETHRHQMDGREYICLCIRDNGPGFTEEMLHWLNNQLDSDQTGQHVGFSNTLFRLRMMYGNEVQMLFSNRGGACIEWLIALSETSPQAQP